MTAPRSLGKRLASGLLAAAVVALAVALLPAPWMAAFFIAIGIVAIYEWAKLSGVESRAGHTAYVAAAIALAATLWLLPAAWNAALLAVCGFWMLAALVVLGYPASAALLRIRSLALLAGLVAIVGAWLAVVSLKTSSASGHWLVIWLIAAAALADTGAYFAGHRFGRRALAPRISPGKTWEGAAGGVLAALAWGVCGALFFGGALGAWLALAALLAVAAILGDLLESTLKRCRGVKESGSIMPGHGGALDRIDSALASAPACALLAPLCCVA